MHVINHMTNMVYCPCHSEISSNLLKTVTTAQALTALLHYPTTRTSKWSGSHRPVSTLPVSYLRTHGAGGYIRDAAWGESSGLRVGRLALTSRFSSGPTGLSTRRPATTRARSAVRRAFPRTRL